jgi:epoxyqueuosine reductase
MRCRTSRVLTYSGIVSERLEHLANRAGMWIARPAVLRELWRFPSLPSWFRRAYLPQRGAWRIPELRIPSQLLSVPGVRRDSAAEEAAYRQQPLRDLRVQNPWLAGYTLQHLWKVSIPASPRLQRASRRAQATSRAPVSVSEPTIAEPSALTEALRARAAEIGLSAIGIAEFDPKYAFVDHSAEWSTLGDTVIVCVVEQNYDSTQTIPSARAERGALAANAMVMDLAAQLAEFLHRHGYTAGAEPLGGRQVAIQYAVASGLGQLGLNGQLLTPMAGSRCRLSLIQTNAPLRRDAPVDYGVPRLCEECQACVRRCPVGAIPAKRSIYRGIEKAKINTVRCWPVVAQAHGCGICMKVCPVQKHGLTMVMDEFERTGKVIGKATDELEGYDWIDGAHYRPGERPKLSRAFTKPVDFPLKLDKVPAALTGPHEHAGGRSEPISPDAEANRAHPVWG